MKTITSSEEFEEEVLNSNEKVMVDFFANWCGPCLQMDPVLEDLSEEMNIKKVDVDSASDVAEEYGIMGLPTVAIFEDGEEVNRTTGFSGKSRLKEFYN